jgi:serine phosphatase RsbU (regulator of sigma subunit)/CheY-like chemotaxis protein
MYSDDIEQLKLLVVDDEPDNLDLLHRTFRREFDVYTASSGSEALTVLEQHGEMAIIISDQRMPQMNGTEFLSRTVERFPDTIRIVLTGYTDVEDLVDAINAGKVFKYITKPWNPKQLKVVVQQAAETYQVLKHRTNTLTRALQRESLFNTVMTAIRESLDYTSMLKTVAETLGRTFEADYAVLYPIETLRPGASIDATHDSVFTYYAPPSDASGPPIVEQIQSQEAFERALQVANSNDLALDTLDLPDQPIVRLSAPLSLQKTLLAVISLYRQGAEQSWSQTTLDLLNSVLDQVSLAISQAKLYQRIQQQTEQMRAELEVARQIQNNLLHQSWPDIPGIKIQARCQPAREVGGDFFEVFVHSQGDIWLAVGDVSGKGVPAALFMASAISVLRRELSQETSPSPEVVMRNLNQSLSDDLMSNNCFITMALVRYRPSDRQLVYANAGHVYPLAWSHRLLKTQQQVEVGVGVGGAEAFSASQPIEPKYLDVRGVPLGILPNWQAKSGILTLAAGDILLLTSDGITEATVTLANTNNSGAMLKQEGLWQLIQQQPEALDLDALLAHIHATDGEQEDDQTVLSLEVV